jgi:two-component system CheB/CheR fusion protein
VGTEPDDALEGLLAHINASRGFDFTGYKRPSLTRRIGKRMQEVGVSDYAEYAAYLQAHPREFGELFDTILINVTSFFRDPDAWTYLAEEIVPRIVAARPQPEEVRVWCAGCASGEETYTTAMLLAEAVGEERFRTQVKIYATDLDEAALSEGRHGRYSSKALEPVPEELRERYFHLDDSGGSFRTDLRRSVIFGRHDLIQDPPISRIDLLVARNTLMYFNPETQGRILGNFHFALRPDGFLFLGKSEVLLTRSTLFAPVDLRNRVFAKSTRPSMNDRLLHLVADGGRQEPEPVDARLRQSAFESVPVAQLAVDLGGVLVLANVQARALFGLAQRDLGRPLQDLELSYRPLELRSLIDQARDERHQVTVRDVEWRTGGDVRLFDVQVAPLYAPDGSAAGTGVTFIDVTRYRRLHESLEDSKSRLETAFEELQSTAEELETTNEELQSTNEELETTNEELQSTNEELETINDELRSRTVDLHEVNAFLESILVSLKAAVVVLDIELEVQAWNEVATELWGLRPDEAQGQHFSNLDIGLPVDALLPLLRSVLAGEDGSHETVVAATNRRGRAIQCHVACSQLLSPTGDIRGVIVLMDEVKSA